MHGCGTRTNNYKYITVFSRVKIHDVQDNSSIGNVVPLISLLQSERLFFFILQQFMFIIFFIRNLAYDSGVFKILFEKLTITSLKRSVPS